MVLVEDPVVDRSRLASSVVGDLSREIADAEQDSPDRLVALAELYHAFSFDEVTHCDIRLDYEPRCSDTCPECHSVWVGSKAGEILRLEPRTLGVQKEQVAGGVRAIRHVHRRDQIIAGLDTGYLLVLDANTLARRVGCHLGRALTDAGPTPEVSEELWLPLEECKQQEDSKGRQRFHYGVTAMLELPGGEGDPVDLLVAMRTPELLVIRLEATGIRVRARHPLPGWSRGLAIAGAPDGEVALCVTRTGELLAWNCRELRDAPRKGPSSTVSSDLIPTAVATPPRPRKQTAQVGAPEVANAVFIGANDGFYIQRDRDAKPVQVAVTRSAVLSLATVRVPARARGPASSERVYVALGLEDGRLRVLEQRLLFDWLDGEATTPLDAHDFRVVMGSEPLVLEILEADETARFVLVALRDHRLRLFHVRSRDAVLEDTMATWRSVIESPIVGGYAKSRITEAQRDTLLACVERLRSSARLGRDAALRYLLVDQVLPDWAERRGACDEELVRRACELARGDDEIARRGDDKVARRSDDKVLYGLSMRMGRIARRDATSLIELSMACLSAMPRRDAQRWRAFVSYHLKRFHEHIASLQRTDATAREEPERTDAAVRDDVQRIDASVLDDVQRMQHWARFVRKYLLLGESFATKEFRFARLAERNKNAYKHFDALLYATHVAEQRYDMCWKTVLCDPDGRAYEILRVDLADDVAIAVTASAEILFVELEHGKRLKIADARPPAPTLRADDTAWVITGPHRDALAPKRGTASNVVRARAARVVWKASDKKGGWRNDGSSWIRIALSWDQPSDTAQRRRDGRAPELHVAVLDILLSPRVAGRIPEVTLIAMSAADYATPASTSTALAAHDPDGADVEPRGEIEVYDLFGLPNGDGFLAGLDLRDTPLALLTSQAPDSPDGSWVMSPLAPAPSNGQEAPPAVSTPVRAVAACELDDHYLAGAGAVDGSLRFVVFDRSGLIVATDVEPMRLVHPINDIAFALRGGDPAGSRVCYVGTENGESLCVLVEVDLAARTITAQQLWRDLHDSPVIVVRPEIRPVDEHPLYGDDVMAIATQDGHLSIYQSKRGSPADGRLSASGNYHFEGMRLDRIHIRAQLRSFAIRRERAGFLAACGDGELRYGELYAPRGSVPYHELDPALDSLYAAVKQDELFYRDKATDARKLAICAMVRIGGDALRNYALSRQLDRAYWESLDATKLVAALEKLLHGLRPEVWEDRARIKLIIRSVSVHVLERSPETILDDCRPGKPPYDRILAYGRVRAVCEYLGQYLLDDAVRAKPGAQRVRMSIMHALFRANVLWHAALELYPSGRYIPLALHDALTVCLRDEKRIVCVEALRAVAVVLRNISIMIERTDDENHRKLVRRSFFPRGLDTLQWLVNTVIGNFARYRHSQSAPLSTPWSYVTVLVLLIRLFPNDALGLCEQLARHGLGDALETIAARLRGKRVQQLRARIHELWIQPRRERADFIKAFHDRSEARDRLTRYEIADKAGDHTRATDLLVVYRRLALLWNVNNEGEIAALVRQHRDDELPRTGPLTEISSILQQLLRIAGAHRRKRAMAIEELQRTITRESRSGSAVPEAMWFVLARVVEDWRSIFDPKTPTRGDIVLERRLGPILSERGNRVLHAVEGDPQQMVMLLRYLHDANARDAFYCTVRLSRELAENYPGFLSVLDVDPAHGQARMQYAELASDGEFQGWVERRSPEARAAVAQTAGAQLARALRCLHAEKLMHGDLRAENVFVSWTGDSIESLTFRLGDLQAVEDLRARSGVASRSIATLMIPSLLRRRVSDDPRQLDLIALTLFVYSLLVDEPLEPGIDQRELTRVVRKLRERADPAAEAVATMLSRDAWRTAAGLESGFGDPSAKLGEFKHKPLAGAPLAKHDVFISYNRDDPGPAHALYEALSKLRLVPFIDEKNVTRKNWKPEVTLAMNQCRAFAILINKAFRVDSYQAKEASFALAKSEEDGLLCHAFSLDGTRPAALGADIDDCNDITTMAKRIEDGFKNPHVKRR